MKSHFTAVWQGKYAVAKEEEVKKTPDKIVVL